jgi:glutamate dehydrogenase
MALVRLGYKIHMTAHPAVPVERNKKGELLSIGAPSRSNEALMRFEIDRLSDINLLDEIKEELLISLADVNKTVADWPAMKTKLSDIISESEQLAHLKGNEEHQEILDFLHWVANNHFTFIGFRAYDLSVEGKETHLKLVDGSGLGTFRDINDKKVKRDIVLHDNLAKLAVDRSNILILTKSTAISTVHRPVHLD